MFCKGNLDFWLVQVKADSFFSRDCLLIIYKSLELFFKFRINRDFEFWKNLEGVYRFVFRRF